ncbi:MAG: pilus assembly protein CpaB [Solirubrobacteraceae bacterium]|jgi:pilus assembly protein CpaB|nr:pilus assembly protein CpaB [Solirubrobacteraceae bacterium]
MTRRRRALLLGGLALLLGGLAASDVASREAALQRQVGGLVDVVVARGPVSKGAPLRAAALAVRRVPRRFAPDGAIADPETLAGLRASVDIAAGTDLTTAVVGDGTQGAAARTGPPIRPGERIAEIVALGAPELVTPGSHVDVLVTPEPEGSQSGRAVLALEDVEVLQAGPAEGGDADADAGKATGKPSPGARVAASLRVTLRQAVYLAAAQDFARELRLLPRAAGDRRRGQAGLAVGADLP